MRKPTTELNGRPAYEVSFTLSEKQFAVKLKLSTADEWEVLAISSSASTLCQVLDDVFKLATGQDFGFRLH